MFSDLFDIGDHEELGFSLGYYAASERICAVAIRGVESHIRFGVQLRVRAHAAASRTWPVL